MSFSNVARALSALSQPANGPAFCDKVSRWLDHHGEAYVASLDSRIGFFQLGRGTVESARLRFGARLLARLFPQLNIGSDADSWDANDLDGVIRQAKTNVPDAPPKAGYYLRGSFWCFSSSSERAWVASAWSEAEILIDAGIRVAATAPTVAGAANLVARWFGGRSSATSSRLLDNLRRLRAQMHAPETLVGMTYVGPNCSGNTTYRELMDDPGATVVVPNEKEWGWVPGEVFGRRVVGWGTKFFSRKTTKPEGAVELHAIGAPDYAKMEVSRGGAMVHELTHALLKTNDQKLGQESLDVVGASMTAALPDASGKQKVRMQSAADKLKTMAPGTLSAYAGFLCSGLARTASEGAFTNADNYRLFCEDAAYYEPRL